MLGTDELLRGANRPLVFTPFLSDILNQILPEGAVKDSKKLITKSIQELEANKEEFNLNKNLMEKFKNLQIKGDLSKEEYTEFQKLLHENYKTLSDNHEVLVKKKINSEISNFNSFFFLFF